MRRQDPKTRGGGHADDRDAHAVRLHHDLVARALVERAFRAEHARHELSRVHLRAVLCSRRAPVRGVGNAARAPGRRRAGARACPCRRRSVPCFSGPRARARSSGARSSSTRRRAAKSGRGAPGAPPARSRAARRAPGAPPARKKGAAAASRAQVEVWISRGSPVVAGGAARDDESGEAASVGARGARISRQHRPRAGRLELLWISSFTFTVKLRCRIRRRCPKRVQQPEPRTRASPTLRIEPLVPFECRELSLGLKCRERVRALRAARCAPRGRARGRRGGR